VLLFRRLFDFGEEGLKQRELRLNQRYTPGAGFPLRAALSCDGRSCPGLLQNISGSGLGLLVDRAATVTADQAVTVELELDGNRIDLPARLAYVAPQDDGILCGVGFVFDDFQRQKAYVQLMQPIAIGRSLRPVPAERVGQNEPQFVKQVFRGEYATTLTVWLAPTAGTPMHSFEFRMDEYFCRADLASGRLESYALEAADSHKGKLSNPVFDASGGLNDEIRRLFRWLVPNLSPAVPDEVRAALQRFAATN